MSESNVFTADFFNTEHQSIYPSPDSLKGIFAYLHFLDGKYFSRYKIDGEIERGSLQNIVQAFESSYDFLYTSDNNPQITFTFDDYFIATNYSMSNAYEPNYQHSFIKSWQLIGVSDDERQHIIDSHSNIDLCGSSYCTDTYVKTYQIKKPAAYKKYILKSIRNSDSNNLYLIIRFFDFFGILCSSGGTKCYFPHYIRTCISKKTSLYPSIVFYLFLFL